MISQDVSSYEEFMKNRTINNFYGSYYKWMFTFWIWNSSHFIKDDELYCKIREMEIGR